MKQNLIELDVPPLGHGLVGLVNAVALITDEPADELLGISSCAFCAYVFDPQFNQHEDEPRLYSKFATLFSNYGPWSSIAYYCARDVREVNALGAVETLKVVVFEIENGRPLVTLTPDLKPAIVTGYRISVEERVVITSEGEFEVRDEVRLQGDNDVFKNWLLLVRPGYEQEWAATRDRQRVNVLRWAVEHARGSKEFFQETCENYAPGLLGLRRQRELLEGLSDPEAAAFAEQSVRMLAEQRVAAATCLEAWADPVAEELKQPEVADLLRKSARAYGRVAHAIRTASTLADALDAAKGPEEEAIEYLTEAHVFFPAPFET